MIIIYHIIYMDRHHMRPMQNKSGTEAYTPK